jgi:hypothetical protein
MIFHMVNNGSNLCAIFPFLRINWHPLTIIALTLPWNSDSNGIPKIGSAKCCTAR